MADLNRDTDMLEDLFAGAKQDPRTAPDSDLLGRVLEDALAMQPAGRQAPTRPRKPRWRQLVNILGGWPSVAGLASAAIAGVWVGYAAFPAMETGPLAGFLDDGTDVYLADLDSGFGYLPEDSGETD